MARLEIGAKVVLKKKFMVKGKEGKIGVIIQKATDNSMAYIKWLGIDPGMPFLATDGTASFQDRGWYKNEALAVYRGIESREPKTPTACEECGYPIKFPDSPHDVISAICERCGNVNLFDKEPIEYKAGEEKQPPKSILFRVVNDEFRMEISNDWLGDPGLSKFLSNLIQNTRKYANAQNIKIWLIPAMLPNESAHPSYKKKKE